MVTRLTDAIVPEVFGPYMLKETAEKASVFTSGLVTFDSNIASKLANGGEIFQVPVWDDLDDTGSKIGSDNPAEEITPDKIGSFKMRVRRQFRTQAWSSANLVGELAGDKPMDRVISRVSAWWARDLNKLAVQTMNGIINDNTANDSGDMTYVAGVGTGGSLTPTAAMSAEVILEAGQTMGDVQDELSILMVHSRTATNLKKLNLIDYIPDARGEVNIPTYLGKVLIVSDTLPVTLISGSNYAYTSYLTKPGFLAFGESAPEKPVETESYPAQGNGAGVEALFTRRQFAMHPLGFDWTETAVVGDFPTNAELATAGNWDRKFPERKQVPFCAIVSLNG